MPFDLDEKFVIEAEGKLGARLPESYRKAMMNENGGEVSTEEDEWDLYPIMDSSEKKRLARTCNDICYETKSNSDWNGFPDNAVAIAYNGYGDQLVFLSDGGSFNSEVYFWSHETGELTLVAKDFTELERL